MSEPEKLPLRLDKIEKEFIRYERSGQLHSYALEIIADLRLLQQENERLKIQRNNCRTAAMEVQSKVHEWRAIIEAHNAKQSPYEAYNTQHWAWMPDEENYLETLSCPVLIPAECLRQMLEEAEEKGRAMAAERN